MKARICMMVALALVAGAQLGTARSAERPHPRKTHQVVLVAQDEALMAYDIDHQKMYTFMRGGEDQFSHWVNGPPCFIPGDRQGRFLEADDDPFETWTAPNGKTENGDANAFFGLFTKTGVRDHSSDYGDDGRVGAEVPMQDPAGCAFDAHGNFFGVDVGFNHAPLMGDGQLVEFFAPDYKTWCVLDKSLSQPGMVAFDDQGGLLVPEAGFGQILRYSNFPSDAGHCGGSQRSIWMLSAAMGIGTPIGIVRAPDGGWAVSSVLVLPAIYHVTVVGGQPIMDGLIAAPGPNTGTPFGLGYDKLGNLYWADLGVRPFPLDGTDPTDPIDSAPNQSGFAMVKAGGLPIATRIASNWQFADGVTVVPRDAITLPDD